MRGGGVWSWAESLNNSEIGSTKAQLLLASKLMTYQVTPPPFFSWQAFIHLVQKMWEMTRLATMWALMLHLLILKLWFQKLLLLLLRVTVHLQSILLPLSLHFSKRKPCMSFGTRRLIILPELSTGHCCRWGLFLLFSSHLEPKHSYHSYPNP